MARKGSGRAARLCYAGHTLLGNCSGLVTQCELTQATGTVEREAGLRLLGRQRGRKSGRVSVAAGVRELRVTPHVARKNRYGAIDGRATRQAGYGISQRRCKLIEEGFGWVKTVGGLRKLRHRGTAKVAAIFTFSCAAYNLVRLRSLLAEPSSA